MGVRSCALVTKSDRAIANVDANISGIFHNDPGLVTITRERMDQYLHSLKVTRTDKDHEDRSGERLFTDEEIRQILNFSRPFFTYRSKFRGKEGHNAAYDFDSQMNEMRSIDDPAEQAKEMQRWLAILDKQVLVNINAGLRNKKESLDRLYKDIPDPRILEHRVSAFTTMFQDVVSQMVEEYGYRFSRKQIINGVYVTISNVDPDTKKLVVYKELVGGMGNIFARIQNQIRERIYNADYKSQSAAIILMSLESKVTSAKTKFYADANKLPISDKEKDLLKQWATKTAMIYTYNEQLKMIKSNFNDLIDKTVNWLNIHFPSLYAEKSNLIIILSQLSNDENLNATDKEIIKKIREKVEKLHDEQQKYEKLQTTTSVEIESLTANIISFEAKNLISVFTSSMTNLDGAIQLYNTYKDKFDAQVENLNLMLKNFAALSILARFGIRSREGVALKMFNEENVRRQYKEIVEESEPQHVKDQLSALTFEYKKLGVELKKAEKEYDKGGKKDKELETKIKELKARRLELLNKKHAVVSKADDDFEKSDNNTDYNYGMAIDDEEENMTAMEESIKDAFGSKSGEEDTFLSIGESTRLLLSSIPRYIIIDDNNNEYEMPKTRKDLEDAMKRETIHEVPEVDDLGFTVYEDPQVLHQLLLQDLLGIQTPKDMLNVLFSIPRYRKLYDHLSDPAHSDDLTTFFVDMSKDFQPYSKLMQVRKPGSRFKYWIMSILNKSDQTLTLQLERQWTGRGATKNTVFDRNGRITKAGKKMAADQQNDDLAEFRKEWFFSSSTHQRMTLMRAAFNAFGIKISNKTLQALLRDKKKRGILYTTFFGKGHLFDKLNSPSYTVGNSILDNFFKDAQYDLVRLGRLMNSNNPNTHYAQKIFAMNGKGDIVSRYSNVMQSHMGKFYSKLQWCVKYNKKDELREYLWERYGENAIFGMEKNSNKCMNEWIHQLLLACQNSAPLSENEFIRHFASQEGYARDLGSYDQVVEDYGMRQSAISVLTYFMGTENNFKSDWGYKPVFVLGDSGAVKYIQSRNYNLKDLKDKYVTVYYQERARMRQVNSLLKEGIKVVAFTDNPHKFSYLTFLNDEIVEDAEMEARRKKIIEKVSQDKDANIDDVKALIEWHFKNENEKFIKECETLGLFDTYEYQNKDGEKKLRYVHFPNIAVNKDNSGSPSHKELRANLSLANMNIEYSMIQQQQMFTIDPSFYPSTKDMQKRYKELHAPGRGLNITALNPYSSLRTDKRFGSRYQGLEEKDRMVSRRNVGTADETVGKERVLYFSDIKMSADNGIEESFRKSFSPEEADKLIAQYKKCTLTDGQGYRSLDSYRKVMIMAGGDNWTEVHELAYLEVKRLEKIVKENPEYKLTKDDFRLLKEANIVMNPIKPYLYGFEHVGLKKEGNMEVTIPVQHKYAEAVIIPLLYEKGTLMHDLGNYMQDNDIDLVCSSKCVKVGEWGTAELSNWKQEGDIAKIFSDPNVALHEVSYQDYLIQTNVPDHLTCTRLMGTQIKKLIFNGLEKDHDCSSYVGELGMTKTSQIKISDKTSVDLSGKGIVRFYNSLLTANILQELRKYKLTINQKEDLEKILIDTVAGSNRSLVDHFLSYCLVDKRTINDDSMNADEFRIPLNEPGLSHEVTVKLISLFKKFVQKQQISGGAAVQVSELGITKKELGRDLKFEHDANGNITYAECEIPFDFEYENQYGEIVKLDYDTYCDEYGYFLDEDGNSITDPGANGENLTKAKIAVEFPGILERVAYRIPTESNYSMFNLRVVKCSRKIAGGTIRMPAESTTMAGFDFDIDKLYFITRKFALKKGGSLINYDFTKTVTQNNRVARDNMILTIIQQRLLDKSTIALRSQPGGFPDASRSARIMRELTYAKKHNIKTLEDARRITDSLDGENDKDDPEPQVNSISTLTWLHYTHQNYIAAKLIGIIANHNTHHVFASQLDEFRLRNSIEFAGKKLGNLVKYENELDENDHSGTPQHTVAEFLAASVDAVKDPVLNYLNLNINTINVGLLLARVGFTSEDIGLLLNQPIIKEACDYAENNRCGLARAINAIAAKYDVKDLTAWQISNTSMFKDVDVLAEHIINGKVDKNNRKYQLSILKFFTDLNAQALSLAKLVNNSKLTASNSIGSTYGDLYSRMTMLDVALSSINNDQGDFIIRIDPINGQQGDLSILKNEKERTERLDLGSLTLARKYAGQIIDNYLNGNYENPFMFEQAMLDAVKEFLATTNPYMHYDDPIYANVRQVLCDMSSTSTLSADIINAAHTDFMQYVLSETDSKFNPNFVIWEIDKDDLKGEDKELAEYLESLDYFKDKDTVKKSYKDFLLDTFLFEMRRFCEKPSSEAYLEKYAILNYVYNSIRLGSDDDGHKIYYLNTHSESLMDYSRNEIASSWAQMCSDPNEDIRKLAEEMYFYFYHKSGFVKRNGSFIDCAPTVLKEHIKIKFRDSKGYEEFLSYPQWIRTYFEHNANNTKDTYNFLELFLKNHAGEYSQFCKKLYYNGVDTATFINEAEVTIPGTERQILYPSVTLTFDVSDPTTWYCVSKKGRVRKGDKMESGVLFYPLIQVQYYGNTYYYIAENPFVAQSIQSTTEVSMTYKLLNPGMMKAMENGELDYSSDDEMENVETFSSQPPLYLRPTTEVEDDSSQGISKERGAINDNNNSECEILYHPERAGNMVLVRAMVEDYLAIIKNENLGKARNLIDLKLFEISFWSQKDIKEALDINQDEQTRALAVYNAARKLLLNKRAELSNSVKKVDVLNETEQLLVIDERGQEQKMC